LLLFILTILIIFLLVWLVSIVEAIIQLPFIQKIWRFMFWIAMGPPLAGVAIFLLLMLYDHYAQTNTADQFMTMIENLNRAMEEFNASRSGL